MSILRSIAVVVFATFAVPACVVPAQQGAAQPGYQAPAQPLPPAGPRSISFNGHAATDQDLQILEQLEAQWGARLPDGAYWYDNVSGAAGAWGGPGGGVIQAGLGLGGTLPASASGGGDGRLTGVFINGRELHPQDVSTLQSMVGEVPQGSWFVDAYGNFGQEGGPVLGNLVQIAQANKQQRGGGNGGGGDSYYDKDQNGSVFVGGGCVSVTVDSGSYYGSGC